MKTNRNRTSRAKRQNRTRTSLRSSEALDYSLLESRHLLAMFVVDSIGDDASGVPDGNITLREAIIAANTNSAFGDAPAGDADGDNIRFDGSLAGQTITLTNGEFQLSDDVAILGGENNITIDANLLSRIFNINSTEQILIRDIALVNGSVPDSGGAILIDGAGNTILNNVSISDSSAAGLGGGAIASANNNVLIQNSDLGGNMATFALSFSRPGG